MPRPLFTDKQDEAFPRHNQGIRSQGPLYLVRASLVQLVLQGHVRLGLEADACAEDIGKGSALLSQGVDHWGAGRRERCLEHIAEDAEDAVEALVAVVNLGLPPDARHHFCDKHEVDDEGRGEEGVLADVEYPVKLRLSVNSDTR